MTDKRQIKHWTYLAIMVALTAFFGIVMKLPTMTGFVTLLDVGIYFTAFYSGKKDAAIVGGFAAFLVDLLSGYPQYMFFSLVIHACQGYLAGLPLKKVMIPLSLVVMVGGYFLVTGLLYHFSAGVVDSLPNLLQGLVGVFLGYVLNQSVRKLKGSR